MRKGKMVAQGAHASMKVLLDLATEQYADDNDGVYDYLCIPLTFDIEHWLKDKFTKIVVGVNSEDELLEIYRRALDSGLLCSLIQDAGLTEFKEPTYTAVAVGPDEAEKIDKITGHLKLL